MTWQNNDDILFSTDGLTFSILLSTIFITAGTVTAARPSTISTQDVTFLTWSVSIVFIDMRIHHRWAFYTARAIQQVSVNSRERIYNLTVKYAESKWKICCIPYICIYLVGTIIVRSCAPTPHRARKGNSAHRLFWHDEINTISWTNNIRLDIHAVVFLFHGK